jgi:polar amino acid transport system permease protein
VSTSGEPAEANPDSPIKAVRVRHPGRWVAAVALCVAVAMMIHTLVSKIPSQTGSGLQWRFLWGEVGQLIFSAPYISGAEMTLWLTVVAMSVGIVGGLLVAMMRLSPNPLLKGTAWTYTWFFRGTPVIVQIFFWYNILSVYPSLSIGVPFGPAFWQLNPNKVITGFIAAAVLGLGLNEAAYMSEIYRGGILSVDGGQIEAAQSLGMRRQLTMRRIVLPQALRVIIPPTGNEVISMLKTTSLVAFVGIAELLYQAQATIADTYQTIPPYITISLWYLAMTTVLSIGQYFLERHYRRGTTGDQPDGLARLWARMVTKRRVEVFPVHGGLEAYQPTTTGHHG